MPVTLTSFHEFSPDSILFSDPQTIYPQQDSQTEYHKVYLQYSHEGDRRDLVINSPAHLMSFGIQEKRDRETNDVIGYHIPVILWNRRGATEEEKQFTDTLHKIVDTCKSHIQSYYDTDPEKLNLLSWRTQEGVEPYPMLYLKLITNRKTNRIMTLFINEDTNEELDPAELINKKCLVTVAIKFENLYIGDNLSLQVKLYEVLVKFLDKKKKNYYRPHSLLRPTSSIKHRKPTSIVDQKKELSPTTQDPSHFANNPYQVLQEEDEVDSLLSSSV